MAKLKGVLSQVNIYPQSAIARMNAPGFSLYDRLGNLLAGWSDAAFSAFENLNPTAGLEWATQPNFSAINNAVLVRFLCDGQVAFGNSQDDRSAADAPSSVAGMMIRPRMARLDGQIGSNAGVLDAGNTDNNWESLAGTWKTVLPTGELTQTCILNTGGESFAVAQSGEIAANRSMGFDVLLTMGVGGAAQPGAAFDIGDKWRIYLPHGGKPQLFKLDGGTWAQRRTFKEAPAINCAGGAYCFYFYRIAGRGVFEMTEAGGLPFSGQAWWWLDTLESLAQYAGNGLEDTPKAKEVTWPAAPVVATAFNVHLRVGYRQVKWNGSGATATFTRRARRYTDLGADPSPQLVTHGGWEREGTSIALSLNLPDNYLEYTATLTGSPDGIDSPFITVAVIKFLETWNTPEIEPLDISGAVKRIHITLPLPTAASGGMARLTINHEELKTLAGWADYLQSYSPVVIKTRRQYDDGSTDAGWTTLFTGYAISPSRALEQVNGGQTTLVCFDENFRLRDRNALVTRRHPPLDWVFMQRASAVFVPNGESAPQIGLYAAECAQEIVRLFLGDATAAAINGTGDPLRFLPANHPPILSNDTDSAGYLNVSTAFGEATQLPPLTSPGWRFPAPHGQDARSWIERFCRDDRTAAAFMRLPGGAAPVFVYGRILQILADRTPRRLPDNDYIGDVDINRVITRLSTEHRVEADINEVEVYSLSEPGMEGFIPALRMANARVPDDDPASPLNSWRRVDMVRSAFALTGAADIANHIISEIAYMKRIWPGVDYRFDPDALPGDPLFFVSDGSQSDSVMEVDELYVRNEGVEHELDFSGQSREPFKTTSYLRPLTASERAALGV